MRRHSLNECMQHAFITVTMLRLTLLFSLVYSYTDEILYDLCEDKIKHSENSFCPMFPFTPWTEKLPPLLGDCQMCQKGLESLVHTVSCQPFKEYMAYNLLDYHAGICRHLAVTSMLIHNLLLIIKHEIRRRIPLRGKKSGIFASRQWC